MKKLIALCMTFAMLVGMLSVMTASASVPQISGSASDDFTSYTIENLGDKYHQNYPVAYSTGAYNANGVYNGLTGPLRGTTLTTSPSGISYVLSNIVDKTADYQSWIDTDLNVLVLEQQLSESAHVVMNVDPSAAGLKNIQQIKVSYRTNYKDYGNKNACAGFKLFVSEDDTDYYYFGTNNTSGHTHGADASDGTTNSKASGHMPFVSKTLSGVAGKDASEVVLAVPTDAAATDGGWITTGYTTNQNVYIDYDWTIDIESLANGNTEISWKVVREENWYNSGTVYSDSWAGSLIDGDVTGIAETDTTYAVRSSKLADNYKYPIALVSSGGCGTQFTDVSFTGTKDADALICEDFSSYEDNGTNSLLDTSVGKARAILTTPDGGTWLESAMGGMAYVDKASESLVFRTGSTSKQWIDYEMTEIGDISKAHVELTSAPDGSPRTAGFRLFTDKTQENYYAFYTSFAVAGDSSFVNQFLGNGVWAGQFFVTQVIDGEETLIAKSETFDRVNTGFANTAAWDVEIDNGVISWNVKQTYNGSDVKTWSSSFTEGGTTSEGEDIARLSTSSYKYPIGLMGNLASSGYTKFDNIKLWSNRAVGIKDNEIIFNVLPQTLTNSNTQTVVVGAYDGSGLDYADVKVIAPSDIVNGKATKTLARSGKAGLTYKLFYIDGDLTGNLTPLMKAVDFE